MRLRSDTFARLAAGAAIAALALSCQQLRAGAEEARARLDREREQLAVLAQLQSHVDLERRPDLEQLVELRGLFGESEVRWTCRDGCSYLTFGDPFDDATEVPVVAEVAR